MIPAIKAEFRKLFTVRSTYFILLIVLAFEVLLFWWVKGYHAANNSDLLAAMKQPNYLSDELLLVVSVLGMLYGIAVVLLVTHEYRYNTIMYTLVSSKNRMRVFVAKLFVVTVYALLGSALFATLAPLLTLLGLHMHHLHLSPQQIVYSSVVWRTLFAGWALLMYAAIISLLVRNQIGAFAAVFLIPTTIENLLTLLIHDKHNYLPYTANAFLTNTSPSNDMSFYHAALVVLAWIVGGLAVAWALFRKRDAN